MSVAASGRSSSPRARSSSVALAARRLGRPLKWIEDRRENLISSNHARADVAHCTFAARCRRAPARYLHRSHRGRRASFPVGATGGAGALVGLLFTGPYKCPARVAAHARGLDEHVRTRCVPRTVDVRDRRARADGRRRRAARSGSTHSNGDGGTSWPPRTCRTCCRPDCLSTWSAPRRRSSRPPRSSATTRSAPSSNGRSPRRAG